MPRPAQDDPRLPLIVNTLEPTQNSLKAFPDNWTFLVLVIGPNSFVIDPVWTVKTTCAFGVATHGRHIHSAFAFTFVFVHARLACLAAFAGALGLEPQPSAVSFWCISRFLYTVLSPIPFPMVQPCFICIGQDGTVLDLTFQITYRSQELYILCHWIYAGE